LADAFAATDFDFVATVFAAFFAAFFLAIY
jgi:hypothetical protein